VSAEQKIKELGLQLPAAPKPVASYSLAVVAGELIYLAGHLPVRADGELVRGRLGAELTVEQGREAARLAGLAMLATLRAQLGSLDRVERLVKATGYVNCTSDFTDQPAVLNGFSDLMADVFGTAGKGARSAVGVGSLPLGAAVEIDAVFLISRA